MRYTYGLDFRRWISEGSANPAYAYGSVLNIMTAITRDTDARGRLTEIHHRRHPRRIEQKNPSRAITVDRVFIQITQVYRLVGR